jgi:hypothetical protein
MPGSLFLRNRGRAIITRNRFNRPQIHSSFHPNPKVLRSYARPEMMHMSCAACTGPSVPSFRNEEAEEEEEEIEDVLDGWGWRTSFLVLLPLLFFFLVSKPKKKKPYRSSTAQYYSTATKARKIRKPRFKDIVDEVIEPVAGL